MKNSIVKFMIMLGLLVVIAGCATKKEHQRILFPVAPEEPRFEWLATIVSPADLGEAGAGTLFLGEDLTPAFRGPTSVVATSDGRIIVSDIYNRNLKFIDLKAKQIGLFNQSIFERNVGLAVDAQDQIYVSDANVQKILVYSSSGQPLYTIGSKDVFNKPTFMAVNDSLARLYVTDTLDNAVKVFSLDGEFLFSFGQNGAEEGSFFAPQGLAIDSEGQVFVADMLNARIQVFTADGEFVYAFGQRGVNPEQFENPKDLAFDSEGHLLVVDARRPNFRIFDPDGTLLLVIGGQQRSQHKLGFSVPSSVFVDRNDRIIITDLLNTTVTVWQYFSEAFKSRQATQPSGGS